MYVTVLHVHVQYMYIYVTVSYSHEAFCILTQLISTGITL